MKTKITASIFIITLLLSAPLFATSPEEIVRQVQAVYEKAQDVSSEFSQKIEIKSLERTIEKTGKAFFKKPGKLKVEYDGEEGRSYTSDGSRLWIYDKGDTQVNVYKVSGETLPEEALAFLGGLGNIREQFKVSAPTANDRKSLKLQDGLDWIALLPKNPESSLDRLVLGFDPQTHTVREAFMKNDTGNQSHYFFKNVLLNSNLGDTQFVFAKPAGVKEIKN